MFLEQNMASCNGMASPSFFHPNFILQMQTTTEDDPHNHQHQHQHQPSILNPLLPSSNPQDFSIGMAGMMGKRSVEACEAEEELSDDCSLPGEKKRRLNIDQVRTLEKNFELGNKLEPERKMQLARALGLQPRQIAIWFQNRRARWKTKQLEKDYDLLKKQFDNIKAENDALQLQNKNLQAEILALKGREAPELINLNKETEGSCSNRSDNSSEINLDLSRAPTATAAVSESPLNHNQSIPFFPSMRPPMISHLLQSSSSSDLHCIKIEHGVPDEHFGNLLCGMEDQTAFWPWPDHHNQH